MCLKTRAASSLFFLLLSLRLAAQDVYVDFRHKPLYDFLDEMGSAQLISVNTVVKPYTRMFIASRLQELSRKRDKLNKRQQQQLDFFLKDYNKELQPGKFDGKRLDLLYYKDSLFTFSLNPILGYSWFHNDSGSFHHRWGGAEAFGYIGSHFGLYAALRDNGENIRMTDPQYLNHLPGQVYKVDGVSPGGDYSEMTGGITYAWNWGSLGLLKDRFTWGDNAFGANIFSDRAPSYARLDLRIHPVEWMDFRYFHGWLVSEIIDSSRSYWTGSGTRLYFRPKYVAANLLTLTAWKQLRFSIGNSIVYDGPVQPAYLIPVFFYKSVDHSQSGAGSNYLGQNSQMFFNISSRQIRNLHLYLSVFIDEFSFSNWTDADKQSNFVSMKAGATLSNFPLQNVELLAEYTRTNPVTYRHYIPTATFASNEYGMGHYLGDNAQEIALGLTVRPIARLTGKATWIFAQKGEEYPYTGQAGTAGDGLGLHFIDKVFWESSEISLEANYEILNGCYVFSTLSFTDQSGVMLETYSMPYYKGKQTTVNIGANIGF